MICCNVSRNFLIACLLFIIPEMLNPSVTVVSKIVGWQVMV